MNPEPTRKLIAELRSGKHRQTHSRLEDPDGAKCCLGVACRAAIADGVPVRVWACDDRVVFDGVSDTLPASVAGWLGVYSTDPRLLVPPKVRESSARVRGLPTRVSATALNDEYELTFEQIADCFEATLEAGGDE